MILEHHDWTAIEAEARARAAAARQGNGRSLIAVLVAGAVALLFSPPLALAFGLLGGMFYLVVVRPAKVRGPEVLLGEVVGREMWRKVTDPNELPPGVGKQSEIQHFVKWWLTVRAEHTIRFGASSVPERAPEDGDRQFAVPRDVYMRAREGERMGFVLTPANDLLGCVDEDGGCEWFEEPLDQSWRRGGYTVLPDPEAWPEP